MVCPLSLLTHPQQVFLVEGEKNPEKPELFHVMELLSIIPATSGRGHLHFTGDHEDRSVSMTLGRRNPTI